jgi:choline dehydrogenase-like flavoprotein
MHHDFDVIVIGSGAGGGTFAYACARAGKRVLLVEKGPRAVSERDEAQTLIAKKPYDDRPVEMNGRPRHLYAGGVLGGGTALYGAALMRPSPDDFHPGKFYAAHLPRSAWDWPIDYAELEPYYTEAEQLYGVAGAATDDFGPLGKPVRGFPGEPLPVMPINCRLMAANEARGLHPFRLPLAIDQRRCLRCAACAGYLCPNGARQSSAQLLEPNDSDSSFILHPSSFRNVEIQTSVEAERFERDGAGRVDGVHVRDRATGRPAFYRAQRYALAAGALGSPLLLLRSGFENPLLGRHYMYHLSPIVAGVFPRGTGGDTAFIKQVGFADYYFGTPEYPHKLGLIQSLPVPGPLLMAKAAGRRLPRALVQFLRRRMLPLTGIVEDLPNPDNRVTLGADGTAQIRHSFAPFDRERGRQLSRLMRKVLKRAGALFCLTRAAPSDEHVAHQCGTLRFGTQPEHAVVAADGRLFGQPNVFVVDGSIFPTSLGVGPALTIMANALRVARVASGEL